MDGNQENYWRQGNRMCLSTEVDHNLNELQQQQIAKDTKHNFTSPISPIHSDLYRFSSSEAPLHSEGDQVVPISQRWSRNGAQQKETKPLPPLPDPEELMTDEAAENEVEFFTSERRRLLPKSCSKTISRGRRRDCGQVNYAYQEREGAGEISSMAFSWPSRDKLSASRGGANNWSFALQRDDHQCGVSTIGDSLENKQQKLELSRFQFSWIGASARDDCSFASCSSQKPQVPPRVPIPPKPTKGTTSNADDKPPKIPPRVPLVPPCPPRTPSPKRLPIYINGVMPVTQSFAANPNYVSKALQRQDNVRTLSKDGFSPCIVPILRDGKKASTTHYILLPPGRSGHTHRRERIMSEPNGMGNAGGWQNR